ncbi:pyridoxamine 5'-phosphate oxidase [Pararhizobium antarcticum]|uniref:Pyridoxine/pyridoxamine 5'-phosphate oxidase n=2 Tax=Pararhizobium antarcticum TaxID=1798805 RepID=A0A657LWA2_9HYPH|nr:pyridoxamine 5'-phosphate oxidase [Pararhizobium antarcticum]OJF98842.1 pyridoxamine 5'-phosphate oxidase [Pararhizobium antarcticum]
MSETGLTTGDFTEQSEPFSLFGTWMDEAKASEINDPNGVALATVDADGLPNVRMVLLKDFDERGFVFYTNFESQKGQELLGSMKAALCFHWKSLRRQVRLRGPVEIVSNEEADEYYKTRPRGSRIGAWASKQSRPLESRFALEKAVAEFGLRYAVGEIPRPDHWSGFRIRPTSIEFWKDGAFRLHDRIEFRRRDGDVNWEKLRMYP